MVWHSNGSSGGDYLDRSIHGQRFAAEGAALGAEFQVNTYTTGDQQLPAIATDADGDFIVVWHSNGSSGSDTLSSSVQGQRYSAAGAPLGAQFQVNSYTTGDQQFPAIATDPNGDFIVAWRSSEASGGDISGSSVQGQRFLVTGNLFGQVFLDRDSDGIQDGGEPGIAGITVELYDVNAVLRRTAVTDGNGDYFLKPKEGSWTVKFVPPSNGFTFTIQDEGGDTSIATPTPRPARPNRFPCRSTASKTRSTPASCRSSSPTASRAVTPPPGRRPCLSEENRRQGVVSRKKGTHDERGEGTPSQERVAFPSFVRFRDRAAGVGSLRRECTIAGAPWAKGDLSMRHAFAVLLLTAAVGPLQAGSTPLAVGPQFQVNSYTTSSQRVPAIASDADGDFVVVWDSNGASGGDTSASSVQGQRYSAAGVPQGAQFQVNSYTTSTQFNPAIATAADGDFVVVWESNGSDGGDTLATSAQGQRYSAAGVPQGAQFQVNSYTTSAQIYPAIASDADGDFVVVWQSNGSSGGDTSSLSVQGQRYSAAGVPQGTQFQANSYTTSSQRVPAIASDADGDFVVAWESSGSSGGDTSLASVQGQRYLRGGRDPGRPVSSQQLHHGLSALSRDRQRRRRRLHRGLAQPGLERQRHLLRAFKGSATPRRECPRAPSFRSTATPRTPSAFPRSPATPTATSSWSGRATARAAATLPRSASKGSASW